MYRVNTFLRNVLITADEVVFHASTKHEIDPRMIDSSIIVAEERIIMAAIGHKFYYDLIDSKNKEVTDENKADLQTKINESLPEGADQVVLNTGDVINSIEFLSDDDKKLWKQHLWKLTAEAVILAAYPDGFVQFGSTGVMHQHGSAGPMNQGQVVTPELSSFKYTMDKKMSDRIDPLTEAMHLWICNEKEKDKEKYPKYCKTCGCDEDGVANKRKSQFVLGIYDDE